MIIGTVMGLVIRSLASWNGADILDFSGERSYHGASLGAFLWFLSRRWAALLMEGLIPMATLAAEFVQKRFKNRGKIYMRLDSAVVLVIRPASPSPTSWCR